MDKNMILVPLMTAVKFSELSGIPPNVLRGMLDKGHLPSQRKGRHRLVDVFAMLQKKEDQK